MDLDRIRENRMILLDTNFIMTPFQLKIDVITKLQEKELATITPVIKELEKIPHGKAGKQLIEEKKIRIILK